MKRCRTQWFVGLAAAFTVLCCSLPGLATQDQLARIPAEPPLSGTVWTVVVPLILFGVAFAATLGLYRRFSRDGSDPPPRDRG